MASGSGSQRDSQLPNRTSHSTHRHSPYPPPSSRNLPVWSGSASVRTTADLNGPAAQTIITAPSAWEEEQRMNIHLKDLTPAFEAYYNAALPTTSTKRSRCTENTRVEVLDTIWMWTHGNEGVKIYWLNGMAGTGKTTIAYTLCEMLFKNRQLGASFFCSRNSPECRDANKIVPTIAYQLGRYSRAYRKALCDVLENDPDMAKRNIETQFEYLVVNPVGNMGEAMPVNTVVVIDALDECTDVGGTKDVLELLLRYADNLPLKFFVASRPEPLICGSMESRAGAFRSILWLHDIEQSLVEADIRTYLNQALRHSDISPSDINRLASLAGCLFIFAATAVRYITLDDGAVDTCERLRNVLDSHTVKGDKQYQELDSLYSTILAKALDRDKLDAHEVKRRQRVLWTVVCAREPLNPAALSELLNIGNERQIRLAIQSLQSVLHMSDRSEVVSTLHASFPDFLLDPNRSKGLFCDAQDHNSYLAAHCFRRMKNVLRFNICNLETSYRLDGEIPDLKGRVNAAVSPGLFYACLYWSDHMTRLQSSSALLPSLNEFMRHQLLFWLEVLSLIGRSSQGESILSKVVSWLLNDSDLIELRDFVHDARNFATTFAMNPCSQSTPHIYISVLPFTSRHSRVWQTYWPHTRGLMQVEGIALEFRGRSALATWAVKSPVHSIAQSSDGKRIVCGSDTTKPFARVREISVWDTSTGASILAPLEESGRGGVSVAFSPDGTRIASVSIGNAIQIRDADNGDAIAGPLCHPQVDDLSTALFCRAFVNSVAFSPDGAQLASGSDDWTIQLWDAHSGARIGRPLEGHLGGVYSVAFSPDGKHLASGSDDRTIRTWDWRIRTAAQQPIKAHTAAVRSVAYSPDGLRLASGSGDCTVRVWNVSSGALLAGPFEGHIGSVSSVSFSPSGSQVVSGSDDCTIRVWDSKSGAMLAGPFEGHTKKVNTVLFSVDGTRIISGSSDGTIRVWDARHRAAGVTKTPGHTGAVNAVAMSPDGTRAVSGSSDHTICVWDTHNGGLVAGPFRGHSDEVNSVAFSPDGARIASGSDDRTLRMCDASSGTLLARPFEGHTDRVASVAFSSDGGRVASGSDDATIRIWNSHTSALVTGPFKSGQPVGSVAFSPDGSRIVSSSVSTVQMWDANNGVALWRSRTTAAWSSCVAFSPDGARLVSSSWKSLLVLDATNGAVLRGPFTGHSSYVFSVAFSPDGTTVLSGSEDRTVRVWDVQSGMMLADPLEGHTDAVSSVAFSPDGARIFSGSRDGTIRVRDLSAIARAGATSSDRWSIDDDGWLVTPHSPRVLWVPSDLRDRLRFLDPSGLVVMNARCTARVDGSTLLGDCWGGCYVPPSDSAMSGPAQSSAL